MKRYLVLLTTLLVIPFATTVSATEVGCGDTVLEDVKLETNLDCRGSGSSGLFIGVDNITVDLNGYTIAGDVTAFAGVNAEGHLGIRIKNGAIYGFQIGGYVIDSRDVTFKHLAFAHQAIDGIGIGWSRDVRVEDIEVSLEYESGGFETTGISLVDVVDAKVARVTFDGSFYGLSSFQSTNVKVEDSSFTNISHVGVRLVNNRHASVKGNRVVGTEVPACYSAIDAVGPGSSHHVQIQDNVLTGCAHGVFVGAFPTDPPSRNFSIRNNRIRLTEDGIRLNGVQDSDVIGNRIHFNYAGIRLWDYSYNNRIAENLVTGNRDWDLFHDSSSIPNNWTANTCVLSNMGDIDCP